VTIRSRRDLRLLSAVLVAQVMLGAAIRVVPMSALRRLLQGLRPLASRVGPEPEERVAWAIEAVGRRLPWLSTCLVRALAADVFLTVPGALTHVRVGVRRSERGALESHAWFERNGRILVGRAGADTYVHLVTLETTTSQRV
jgi:Transglutaminase-like superfamily